MESHSAGLENGLIQILDVLLSEYVWTLLLKRVYIQEPYHNQKSLKYVTEQFIIRILFEKRKQCLIVNIVWQTLFYCLMSKPLI